MSKVTKIRSRSDCEEFKANDNSILFFSGMRFDSLVGGVS
jgi:hypothetical protein